MLNYLPEEEGLDKDFVTRLLKASCDPSLFLSAARCKWDKATRVLTTPEDEEDEKKQSMEQAAWYKDDYSHYMANSPKKNKGDKIYTDPENVYDLDGTHSVKTIHERPGSGYGGSPGAPTFQVGGKQKQQASKEGGAIDVDAEDDDDMSALSNLSKEDLIARLRNASVSSQPMGSAPTSGTGRSHSDSSDDGESSSSSDSSSGSSSSGSSGESVGGQDEAERG